MSFPRYSKYKDSGVEWLAEIPVQWDVQPLLGVAAERDVPNTGMIEDNLLSLSYGRIVQKDIEANDGLLPESFETYQIVESNDIVFRLTDLQNDKRSLRTAIVTQRGIITSAYLAVQSLKIQPRYLHYFLRACDERKVFYSMGGGLRQSMKYSDVKRLPISFPPSGEQAVIAAFLDRETAKIDALVAEQEKLIALLQEKRQAVISHAVTKGLNPAAPMKDSGIEWLGEVPAHWDVKQLRHIAKIVRGASPRPAGDPRYFAPDDLEEGNIPWVTVAEITKDTCPFLNEVSEYLTELGAQNSQFFHSGTVIFSNSGATLGVPKILNVDCCANDGVLAFRDLSCKVSALFLYYFLLTTTERLRTEMKQGGGQPNLNTDIVKNIGFALPPLEEQGRIVSFLVSQTECFDGLVEEANKAIGLLQERRSALISAAVTGKIDVRSLIAEQEAA